VETIYKNVTVKYDELSNTWKFELRGRSRSVESLAKAKEAIDKPVKENAPVFERVCAYRHGYGEGFVQGEITSIAENNYGPSHDVWFTPKGGQRSKRDASRVYPASAKNVSLIIEHERLQKEIRALQDKQSALAFEHYVIPIED
jgi:hypothetical protein